MIDGPGRVSKGGLNIFSFEIRHLLQNLICSQAGCKQIEDVGEADAHASHAGATAALTGIDGDSLSEVHASSIPACPRRLSRCAEANDAFICG